MTARPWFLIAAASVSLQGAALADTVLLKDSVPHITTWGSAEIEVVPDQADLVLGVQTEKPTADAAATATAEAAGRVIDDIKGRGIPAKDIKTSFNIAAQYDDERDPNNPSFRKRTLRGYLSSEHITVRLHDVSKAGALARAFVDKGANEFDGISYSYSKDESARKTLKAAAIRDALMNARAYTDALGLKLGRVLLIGDETNPGNAADLPSRRLEERTSVVIPTEPGTQKITESVPVIWEIEGKAP